MKGKLKMKKKETDKFDIPLFYERKEEVNEMNFEKDIENEAPVNKLRFIKKWVEKLEALINEKK